MTRFGTDCLAASPAVGLAAASPAVGLAAASGRRPGRRIAGRLPSCLAARVLARGHVL